MQLLRLFIKGADILALGCGNGYAASLIDAQVPRSHADPDVMPEQPEIARRRGLMV